MTANLELKRIEFVLEPMNILKRLEGKSVSSMQSLWRNYGLKWEYLAAQEAMRRAPVATMSRLLLWRVRCLLRHSAITRLPQWDLQILLPANWRGIEKLIFAFREYYEPELQYLQQILFPGMIFVDAGACYGIYALAAGKMVGQQGRVMAFEPSWRAFRVLRENIALNRLPNVLAYPVALTETRGKARLYHHPNVGCDSLGRDGSFTETSEEIPTESLDNVFRHHPFNHVDVIKMDVQGAEELVLRGAKETLASSHPIVIFEIEPEGPVSLGLRPYGAWEFLDSLGYRFFVVGRSGVLQASKAPVVSRNVVAVFRK